MLLGAINLLFWALEILIIVEVVFSWVPGLAGRYWEVAKFVRTVTEPILGPFRRLVPPHKTGGLDISPILAIIALNIVQSILQRLLIG